MSGTRRQHLAAAAVLFLPVLALLWAALIKGQVLTADSFLYAVAPFKPYTPPDVTHFQNTILSDIPEFHYAWASYVRSRLHAGSIPTWNSFALSGTPFYANSQTGLTSVTDLPLWLLPLNYGFAVVAALKLWIAGFGAYLVARQLGLGLWPGLLAGVLYPMGAFNIDWLEHMTLVASTAWLPWAVLTIERLLRRPTVRQGFALIAVTALIIDGGHPGTEIQMLGAAAVYALARAATIEGPSAYQLAARLGYAAAATIVGALLMMFFVVPVIIASHGTEGAAARAGGGHLVPIAGLRTIAFPDWWGRPSQAEYGGPTNYVDRTLYDGAVGALLAGLALFTRRGWRRKLPFALIAVIGPAAAFGLPGVHDLVVRLPLFSSVQVSRMTCWFPFGVAVLAAFGLQALIDRDSGLGRRLAAVAAAAIAVVVAAVVTLGPDLHDVRTVLNHFRTGRDYPIEMILALTAIGWWLIFAAATGAAAFAAFRFPQGRRVAVAALVLLAALDMHHFAAGLDPIGPAAKIIPPRPASVAYLQQHAGFSRVVGIQNVLPADFNMTYGIRQPTGLDPPAPTSRYFRLWQLANPAQSHTYGLLLPRVTDRGLRVLSLLGVRYVLADPTLPTLALPDLQPVYRGPDLTVYRNRSATAPAFVPARVVPVAGEAEALRIIGSAGYAPVRQALVGATGIRAGSGSVHMLSDEDAGARMIADMQRPGLVVRNDAYSPGWSASVDGRPALVRRVNDVMQGVVVPRGRHIVTFRYSVPGLTPGLIGSGAALLAMLAFGGFVLIRRRASGRRRRSPSQRDPPGRPPGTLAGHGD